MLKLRVDILTNRCSQGTWCFEGYRYMLSKDIFEPDCFKTSQIMLSDIGRPVS